jgi:hypothetical protein
MSAKLKGFELRPEPRFVKVRSSMLRVWHKMSFGLRSGTNMFNPLPWGSGFGRKNKTPDEGGRSSIGKYLGLGRVLRHRFFETLALTLTPAAPGNQAER